jgi:hypothetical protein
MFKDLFTHEDVFECCAECFGFGAVVMLRDIGPLKAGEKYESLWFQVEKSVIEVFDTPEHVLLSFKVKLEAVVTGTNSASDVVQSPADEKCVGRNGKPLANSPQPPPAPPIARH